MRSLLRDRRADISVGMIHTNVGPEIREESPLRPPSSLARRIVLTFSKAAVNHTNRSSRTSVYAQPLENNVRAQRAKDSERMAAYAFKGASQT